ncbi:integrating conjugative element protein [Ectothiorhodospira haloalkaliphila]|uniref:integrating conjugative element protein n=1 Tax=Ectothiorhodospira haloalkaliphila TaxID=421628 RepID=UPI001EE7B299|nr:integrating conjugative element protein [Ectothiorhodospira haloalkaliphila]MCG5526409.1 integrating conjugative element protein [Ectothiorhodospira haloalkaliphila]
MTVSTPSVMARKTLVTAALTLTGALPLGVAAQPPSSPDSSWLYYEIGGGQAFTRAPNPVTTTLTLGAGADMSLGYSCGTFDPVASVSHQMNQLRDGVDQISNQMAQAANAAIAALPAYILQRANPGLYDLFQNAQLRAEETFQLATKTCEQMEAEIAQGKDPFHEWVVLSKGHSWRRAMGTNGIHGDGNIITTRDHIEDNPGEDGIPWILDRSGGSGQEPIRPVRDVVRAGYNVTANRVPADDGAPYNPADPDAPPMGRYWATSTEAAEWAVQVLGEEEIPTCRDADCPPQQSSPGLGLTRLVEQDREDRLPELVDLVEGTTSLSSDNLARVSAGGITVAPDLIRAIRELPPAEQGMAVGRLADEIATAAHVEKALYLRRFFLAGRMLPEVQAAGPAQKIIQEKVAELEREIDNTLFENRVRKELVSGTSQALLRFDAQRRGASLQVAPGARPDPWPLEGGAVSAP